MNSGSAIGIRGYPLQGDAMAASTVTKTRRRARRASHAPLAGVQRFRFTPDQFEQLARLGLFDHLRVELIGGEIVQMPPIGPEHGSTVD